jgi:hypothetical protein
MKDVQNGSQASVTFTAYVSVMMSFIFHVELWADTLKLKMRSEMRMEFPRQCPLY